MKTRRIEKRNERLLKNIYGMKREREKAVGIIGKWRQYKENHKE